MNLSSQWAFKENSQISISKDYIIINSLFMFGGSLPKLCSSLNNCFCGHVYFVTKIKLQGVKVKQWYDDGSLEHVTSYTDLDAFWFQIGLSNICM